jgi:electron transfer flavoprotein beta subunit
MLNVAVCIKQVPGPDAPSALDPVTYNLVRSGGLVLDDSDRYSIEMALRLTEQAGGGEVVLISMAPSGQTAALRSGLAMGAATALLVSDQALAGSDALGTAKVLAEVVRRSRADLILCATESSDGYTGTVPVQLAELLGYPALSFARFVEIEGEALCVKRQTEQGYDEIRCPYPAVVTVTAGVVEPRYPSFKGIMAAKSKPLTELSLADLGIDPATVGSTGARQLVVSIEDAESRASGQLVVDQGDVEDRIIAQLNEWKVI